MTEEVTDMLFPIFLLLFLTIKLFFQYEKLKWMIYDMNWYDMKPEQRKTFMVLLASVHNPIYFVAQPITILNRQCFLLVP